MIFRSTAECLDEALGPESREERLSAAEDDEASVDERLRLQSP